MAHLLSLSSAFDQRFPDIMMVKNTEKKTDQRGSSQSHFVSIIFWLFLWLPMQGNTRWPCISLIFAWLTEPMYILNGLLGSWYLKTCFFQEISGSLQYIDSILLTWFITSVNTVHMRIACFKLWSIWSGTNYRGNKSNSRWQRQNSGLQNRGRQTNGIRHDDCGQFICNITRSVILHQILNATQNAISLLNCL